MKKSLSIAILFFSSIIFGQNFEQTAAEKSCECIKKLTELNDENYRKCISTSLTESLMIGNVKDNMQKIGTVDGMKTALQNIDTLVKNTCSIDRTAELDEKKDLHYSYSKNEDATNSYKIGKDFMEDGKFKLAIEGFEMALKKDEKFVLALDDMAASHRKLENFDKAIKYYKKSLAIYPEGDFALMNMGVIYNLKKDYKTSNEFYKKLIGFYPRSAEGYYGLGRNYAFLDEDENALINIINAHKIYVEEKSDYVKDSQQMLEVIFQMMKKKGKEKDFVRIASENGINVQ